MAHSRLQVTHIQKVEQTEQDKSGHKYRNSCSKVNIAKDIAPNFCNLQIQQRHHQKQYNQELNEETVFRTI